MFSNVYLCSVFISYGNIRCDCEKIKIGAFQVFSQISTPSFKQTKIQPLESINNQ